MKSFKLTSPNPVQAPSPLIWKYRQSVVPLLIANAVPLFGIVFLHWSTFAVAALYWAENLIIGVLNVVKIATCTPDPDEIQQSSSSGPAHAMLKQMAAQQADHSWVVHASKLPLIPFFAFHYGIFCVVHGAFLFALLGGERGGFGLQAMDDYSVDGVLRRFSEQQLWWGVGALAISHTVSLVSNYWLGGEYRRTFPPMLMMQPYGRVVVLHVAILFGAFASIALGSPFLIVVLLVIGKTALDLSLHLRERVVNDRKSESNPAL